MNGDTVSIKAPKEYSKKFAATFKGKFLTSGNALRIFFLFLEDFGAPLKKRCRHSIVLEPGRGVENWNFPKVVRGGCKRSLGPRERQGLPRVNRKVQNR